MALLEIVVSALIHIIYICIYPWLCTLIFLNNLLSKPAVVYKMQPGSNVNFNSLEHLKVMDRPNIAQVTETASSLTKLLRNPVWVPYHANPAKVESARKKGAHGAFAKLPQDVLDRIVNKLDLEKDGVTILCLGMTNSFFFRILGSKMQKVLHLDAGPWRGQRLVFAGAWAPGIPEGAGTPEEEQDWFSRRIQTLHELHTYPVTLGRAMPMTPYYAPEVFMHPGPRSNRVIDLMNRDRSSTTEDKEAYFRMIEIFMAEPGHLTEIQRVQVLRNLDTKEYVRADVLMDLQDYPERYIPWNDHEALDQGKPQGKAWATSRYDVSPAVTVEGDNAWADVTGQAIFKIHGYPIYHPMWRNSLEIERPFIRVQPIRFFTRMAAMERARVLREEVAAQYEADDAAGPDPTTTSPTIPPADGIDLDLDFNIDLSSDGDSQKHWETDSEVGSDLDLDLDHN
ncbi:hypothetical protein FPSE_12007 [Fusarium pseudograminearum CS3096]|uniref:Uncharacterized protein n=1 Tax=Fusarium pseudograminearum (strain CS3096) TaxID=1028729 RepID=K3V4S4_FUSPC|nr:hypothetical protein FPSE_12007 [Fusarium pseudograminearum CS3096]EKJ67859.1 hypothetical protein FPSE_12007 [Fusarium pseudograminearum CS3096]